MCQVLCQWNMCGGYIKEEVAVYVISSLPREAVEVPIPCFFKVVILDCFVLFFVFPPVGLSL